MVIGNSCMQDKIKTKDIGKKTHIAFSIDNELFDKIELDAKKKKFSLDSTINNILSNYVQFDKEIKERNLQVIPKKAFQYYINKIDVIEHASFIEPLLLEIIQVYFQQRESPITLQNIVQFLETVIVNTGAIDTANHYVNSDGYLIIIIKHSYNLKWSKTCCLVFKNLFKHILNYHVHYEAMTNSLLLKILEKDNFDN